MFFFFVFFSGSSLVLLSRCDTEDGLGVLTPDVFVAFLNTIEYAGTDWTEAWKEHFAQWQPNAQLCKGWKMLTSERKQFVFVRFSL